MIEGLYSPVLNIGGEIVSDLGTAIRFATPNALEPGREQTEIANLGTVVGSIGIDVGARRDAAIEDWDTIRGDQLEAVLIGPNGTVVNGVLDLPDVETPTISGRTGGIVGIFGLTVENKGRSSPGPGLFGDPDQLRHDHQRRMGFGWRSPRPDRWHHRRRRVRYPRGRDQRGDRARRERGHHPGRVASTDDALLVGPPATSNPRAKGVSSSSGGNTCLLGDLADSVTLLDRT